MQTAGEDNYIAIDAGILPKRYIAKKDYGIALGVTAHTDVAEEGYHVPVHRAIDLDRAQEADGIVRLIAVVHDNVVAKFDDVAAFGPRRPRRDRPEGRNDRPERTASAAEPSAETSGEG